MASRNVEPSFARSAAAIAACCLGLLAPSSCADDLRPSTFTGGWAAPEPAPVPVHSYDNEDDFLPPAREAAASAQQEAVEDNDESAEDEPIAGLLQDWRVGHDPAKPCPEEMAFVEKSYCIDRWEGSLIEMTESGPRPFPPTHTVDDRPVRAVSRAETIPQGYISADQAQRACEMAGKRLCTDLEWWTACAGTKKTIFPYGTVHRKDACNEERKLHPMIELYGENAPPEIWYVAPMNNPAISEQQDTVDPTGSRPGCRTPTGIFDLVGNVHEWANDIAGTFHGGAYSTKNKLGCQYVTTAHGFDYHDYSTGFRCCSEPFAP